MGLEGYYFDPKHGGCLRRIVAVQRGAVYSVVGVHGDDEPRTGTPWTALMYYSRDDGTLLVDFAGKPIKPERFLTASYNAEARRISWCDGNTWTKMFVAPAQVGKKNRPNSYTHSIPK